MTIHGRGERFMKEGASDPSHGTGFVRKLVRAAFISCGLFGLSVHGAAGVEIVLPAAASARVEYGAERLRGALKNAAVEARVQRGSVAIATSASTSHRVIKIASVPDTGANLPPEGFALETNSAGTITVRGADA